MPWPSGCPRKAQRSPSIRVAPFWTALAPSVYRSAQQRRSGFPSKPGPPQERESFLPPAASPAPLTRDQVLAIFKRHSDLSLIFSTVSDFGSYVSRCSRSQENARRRRRDRVASPASGGVRSNPQLVSRRLSKLVRIVQTRSRTLLRVWHRDTIPDTPPCKPCLREDPTLLVASFAPDLSGVNAGGSALFTTGRGLLILVDR